MIFQAGPDTAYVNHFFPARIHHMIEIHSGETGPSLGRCATSCFCHIIKELMRCRLVASLPINI